MDLSILKDVLWSFKMGVLFYKLYIMETFYKIFYQNYTYIPYNAYIYTYSITYQFLYVCILQKYLYVCTKRHVIIEVLLVVMDPTLNNTDFS